MVPQEAGHQPIDQCSSELSRSWSNLSDPKIESAIVYDDFVVTAHQGMQTCADTDIINILSITVSLLT